MIQRCVLCLLTAWTCDLIRLTGKVRECLMDPPGTTGEEVDRSLDSVKSVR